MHEQLKVFEASGRTEGVVFIGRAQEKTNLFRTEKRRNAAGHAYPWIVRSTGMVNHFYFYCVDADFGPFFLKFCSYFPYTAKLCLNGHHWAQRQAAKAGIGFTAMDNAFAAVEDPAALQAICDAVRPGADLRLAGQVAADLAGPVHRRRPGCRLPLRHLDPAGRVLPDPDARRPGHRPGLLRTRHPRQPRYRPRRPGRADLRPPHPPRPEAVHPEPVPDPGDHRRGHPVACTPTTNTPPSSSTTRKGRALRTETTINDTWDFDIGKGLVNLPALREIGFSANRRLLASNDSTTTRSPEPSTCTTITDPVITDDRHPDPRAAARPAPQPRPALGAADVPHPTRRVHQPRPAHRSPANSAASTRPPSAPARPPTTCGASDPTA